MDGRNIVAALGRICTGHFAKVQDADPGMNMGRLLNVGTEYTIKHLMHSDGELLVVHV